MRIESAPGGPEAAVAWLPLDELRPDEVEDVSAWIGALTAKDTPTATALAERNLLGTVAQHGTVESLTRDRSRMKNHRGVASFVLEHEGSVVGMAEARHDVRLRVVRRIGGLLPAHLTTRADWFGYDVEETPRIFVSAWLTPDHEGLLASTYKQLCDPKANPDAEPTIKIRRQTEQELVSWTCEPVDSPAEAALRQSGFNQYTYDELRYDPYGQDGRIPRSRLYEWRPEDQNLNIDDSWQVAV